MPRGFAVAQCTDRLARVVLLVADDVEIGKSRRRFAAGALIGRWVKRAEARREGFELGVVDGLIAQHQHVVFEPGRVEALEGGVIEMREIEALDLRAEYG